MKKISYFVFIIVFAGIAIVSFWAYQRYFKKPEPKFLFFQVEKGSIQETIKARGEVVAKTQFDLEFPYTGIIEKIYVKEGQAINQGDILMKLNSMDYILDAQRLEAGVLQKKAQLDKLIAGPMAEDVKVLETELAGATIALKDAEENLKNVERNAEADLASDYDSALAAAQKSVSIGTNALIVLTNLQYSYLQSYDQEYPEINAAKGAAVSALLGGINAEGADASNISLLNGGAKAMVLETLKNPTDDSVRKSLAAVKDALGKVRVALDAMPIKNAITSADKTILNTEKTNVSTEIVTISGKIQDIETQKTTNQKNITTAQTGVNDARSALELAQSDLDFKKAPTRAEDIEIAKAQIQEIKSEIAIIREKINKSTLYAPASGQISKIWYEEKEVFRPGQPVISLNAAGYKIQTDISELEIGKIKNFDNASVAILFDALPGKEYIGKVVSIEPREIIKDEDKYFRVIIYIESNDLALRTGMSTDISINTYFKDNVLKIPELAVYQKDDKKYVKIFTGSAKKKITEKSVQETEVQTGISDGESVEITQGLKEGQIVVVSVD